MEDRTMREADAAAHQAALEEKLTATSEKLQATQAQLQETTKDYILGVPAATMRILLPATAGERVWGSLRRSRFRV